MSWKQWTDCWNHHKTLLSLIAHFKDGRHLAEGQCGGPEGPRVPGTESGGGLLGAQVYLLPGDLTLRRHQGCLLTPWASLLCSGNQALRYQSWARPPKSWVCALCPCQSVTRKLKNTTVLGQPRTPHLEAVVAGLYVLQTLAGTNDCLVSDQAFQALKIQRKECNCSSQGRGGRITALKRRCRSCWDRAVRRPWRDHLIWGPPPSDPPWVRPTFLQGPAPRGPLLSPADTAASSLSLFNVCLVCTCNYMYTH